MELTSDKVKELLNYSPETGVFRWKIGTRKVKVGDFAGCLDSRGYLKIGINKRGYTAHRLAWLYMTGDWPKGSLDHINGNQLDNCWKNLREANKYQQQMNIRRAKNNTSGYKNVFWNPRYSKWEVKGSANGKRFYLGRYKTKEEGNEVYVKWAKENQGEFFKECTY